MNRILVCDDERPILDGLRHLLRGPDRSIIVASSGRAALESIARERPDLLITDVMMPDMSGLDVVAALRSREATKALPIIILTVKGRAQDAPLAREAWGATVVPKPFTPQKLRDLVADALRADPSSSRRPDAPLASPTSGEQAGRGQETASE